MIFYNDLNLPEEEKSVPCPYNKAHTSTKLRFAKHLLKCRRSYTGNDMRECKFNVAHIFPAPEIEYHERNCDDRLHVVKFMEGRKRIAQTDDKTKDEKAQKKAKVDSSDDEWDDHDHHKAAEPIDRRRKVEESKTHIVHFEHMTKSLRNAAREERHQRITQQEKAEKEKE